MVQNKYIKSIIDKTEKKIEKLRNEADEAYNDWAATGYQRYMNKYDRLVAEADELDSFIKPDLNNRYRSKVRNLEAENERMVLLLKSVGNVVDEMKYSFPDCTETRRLEDIVSKFKYECNGVLK